MVDFVFSLSWFPCMFLLFFTFPFFFFYFYNTGKPSSSSPTFVLAKSYPLIGSTFALLANRDRHNQWAAEILTVCPTNTYVLRYLGACMVFTAYPENVKHILSSHFSNYPKGEMLRNILSNFAGKGIVTADGDSWKFQRRILSHEFNPTSLRKFVEEVVKIQIFDRLIPILSMTAEKNSELDLQDILQRFAFDNICKISFGYDPRYLSPSQERSEFAVAYEDATRITGDRIGSAVPFVWKLKRFLKIGSGKIIKQATTTIRESIRKIIRRKKHELKENSSPETADDLLSRIVKDDNLDEDFVIDMVINFILGGQDTTSAALTWFFWLGSRKPGVEKEILKEINQIAEEPGYDDIKDMVYIHAALCESMRLYPPVPVESKEAASDDVLPDGTIIKKGMMVLYSTYAMGRMENVWGSDWNEFKPERWLEKENVTGKLRFVAKDPYTYPVFLAGPRICLGKEMAFLQMKMITVEVLRRFQVVPAANGDDFAPVFVSYITSNMKGGFPVKIEKRTI